MNVNEVRTRIDSLAALTPESLASERVTADTKLKEVSGWIKDHPSEAEALVADGTLFEKGFTVVDKFEKRKDQTDAEKKDIQAFSDSIIKTSIVNAAKLSQSYAKLVELLRNKPDLSLDSLYQNREEADFTLVFPGGETIPVHKAVLEARSPYFAGLFASGMQEVQGGSITLPEENPEVFEAFIRDLYTGQVDITIDNVVELLTIADKYTSPSLSQKCVSFILQHIIETIDFDELKDLFELGENFNSSPIKQAVCNQICANLLSHPSFDPADERLVFLNKHGANVTRVDCSKIDDPAELKELFELGEHLKITAIKQAVCNQVFATLLSKPSFDPNDERIAFLEKHGSYVTKLDFKEMTDAEKEAKKEKTNFARERGIDVEAHEQKLYALFPKFTALEELYIDSRCEADSLFFTTHLLPLLGPPLKVLIFGRHVKYNVLYMDEDTPIQFAFAKKSPHLTKLGVPGQFKYAENLFSGFTELQDLDVSEISLTASNLEEIVTNNPHLRTLCLARTPVSAEVVSKVIPQLKELRNLSIWFDTSFDPNLFSNLERLELVGRDLDPKWISNLINKTEKLEILSLSVWEEPSEICDTLMQSTSSTSLKKIYLKVPEWALTSALLNKVEELKKRFSVELVPEDQPIDFMEIAG